MLVEATHSSISDLTFQYYVERLVIDHSLTVSISLLIPRSRSLWLNIPVTRQIIVSPSTVMSEVDRRSQGPPKLSKTMRTGTFLTGRQRAPTSDAVQAQGSSSTSAAARDGSVDRVQAVGGALSALHLSESSDQPSHRSGAAGISSAVPANSVHSGILGARIDPSGAAQGGLLAPSSSSSSCSRDPPKHPLTNPSTRGNRAPQLSGLSALESRGGSAPQTVVEAVPSSSAGSGESVSGGSGGVNLFLSSGIRGSPPGPTTKIATRQTRQGGAAGISDAKADTSTVSTAMTSAPLESF